MRRGALLALTFSLCVGCSHNDAAKSDTTGTAAEGVDEKPGKVRKLGIELPALVDNFDNSTEVAYTAWPDRLYLIGRDGRIAYKSKPGPFGFKPDQLSEALKQATPPAVKVSQR